MSIMQDHAHRCNDSIVSHFINLNEFRENLDRKIGLFRKLREEDKHNSKLEIKNLLKNMKRRLLIKKLESELFTGA